MRITIQHLLKLKPIIESFGTVFTPKELLNIIKSHGSQIFGENETIYPKIIIERLVKKKFLFKEELEFIYKPAIRYTTKQNANPYDIAISARSRGFFSHYSALIILGIIPENEKYIYINEELKINKINENGLTQNSVNLAFSKSPRISNSVVDYNGYQIYAINSKNTNKIGVRPRQFNSVTYQCSSLERALIECVVRPSYAGGIEKVIQSYINSKGICDVINLRDTLKTMNFTYPYHQLVGFILEYCGYEKEYVDLFNNVSNIDMYMDYSMITPLYSEKWKVYYPNFL